MVKKLLHGMVWKDYNYPLTKTPHNFHLINQNRKIQIFSYTYKSKEPLSNFYFLKK